MIHFLPKSDPDQWALVRSVARSIPAGVDLTDYARIVLALLQARFIAREFGPVLDEAIADAKRLREIEGLG